MNQFGNRTIAGLITTQENKCIYSLPNATVSYCILFFKYKITDRLECSLKLDGNCIDFLVLGLQCIRVSMINIFSSAFMSRWTEAEVRYIWEWLSNLDLANLKIGLFWPTNFPANCLSFAIDNCGFLNIKFRRGIIMSFTKFTFIEFGQK